MSGRSNWSREQLFVACNLYCRLTFGRLHAKNPEIIKYAGMIGRAPGALAMKMLNFASLDPAITETGRTGLPNASAADKDMWNEMQEDWQSFAYKSEAVIRYFEHNHAGPAGAKHQVRDTEPKYILPAKDAEIYTRAGQRFFRESVLNSYNEKCCISGLSVPKMLAASHIVPWDADEKNYLNPSNGLLLSVLHDKAFNMGMITIDEDLHLVVSKHFRPADDDYFENSIRKYEGREISKPEKFRPNQDFLDYHRNHIFRS